MAIITQEFLKEEIADARKTLNHNIAELVKTEDGVEQLKESIASTKGAISAFEYLLQVELKEPETPKPDDSGSEEVREEA